MKKEYGDFQTSISLADRVCNLLKEMGADPDIIIEPTLGEGNFIISATKIFKKVSKIIGIEIQEEYIQKARKNIKEHLGKNDIQIEIIKEDVFSYDFNKGVNQYKEILILGNPPWATNSNLQGQNLPVKSNFKKNKGLDAMTGKANFDISEFIILHLLKKFNGSNGKLALLCKNQVIKNIVEFLPSTEYGVKSIDCYTFDAKKEFDVSVDASLLVIDLNKNGVVKECNVFELEKPNRLIKRFGWIDNLFVSDIDRYSKTNSIDGKSELTWRSGIKHDCSKIMELIVSDDGETKNKLGLSLDIEENLLFPMLKSSDIKERLITHSKRKVIVTQNKTSQDTSYIKESYPKLWNYLNNNKEWFDKRKSSVYNKNLFSVFGIGDYSFAPFKVAISGLYKKPVFTLAISQNKPFFVDDSCYFIGLDNKKHALILFSILNSEIVKEFLKSIAFRDAKRPYTKEILMRISLSKLVNQLSFNDLEKYLAENKFIDIGDIKREDYEEFKEFIRNRTEL